MNAWTGNTSSPSYISVTLKLKKQPYVASSNHIEINNIQKSQWIMYTIYSIIVLRRQIRYLSNDLRVSASRIEVGLGMA